MKKVKIFDVVELIDGNKAIILKLGFSDYLAEIVDEKGIKIENRNIYNDEICKIIYTHK